MKTDKNSRTPSTSGTDTHPELAFPSREHMQTVLPRRERISYEKWLEKYRPIKNPLNPRAPFGGCLFRVEGLDLEILQRLRPRNIWTLLDDGDRNLLIVEGYYFLDRSGYFITELPAPIGSTFHIKAEPFFKAD